MSKWQWFDAQDCKYSTRLHRLKNIKASCFNSTRLHDLHTRHTRYYTLLPLTYTFLHLVRRHDSKFRANCALFDTSMKFGTLIVDTETSIFRYSAKSELRPFPWKPQFINIYRISLLGFVSTIISVVLTFPCTFCFIWRSHLS